MKITYKGHELEAYRGESMTGIEMLFYSIFTEDGYEVDSGFSHSTETAEEYIEGLKQQVDSRLSRPLYVCQTCGEEVDDGEKDQYGLHSYCGGQLDPVGETTN